MPETPLDEPPPGTSRFGIKRATSRHFSAWLF